MCGIHAFYIKEKGSLPLRTFLAISLIVARGGVWVIEQPSSSLVYRHPRFQQMLQLTTVTLRHPICWFLLYFRAEGLKKCSMLASNTNRYKYAIYTYISPVYMNSYRSCLFHPSSSQPAQVFKQAFWMRGWGSRTPKRSILWSNSSAVRMFRTDKKHARSTNKNHKLATTYHDRAGNKRYKGNRNMKRSQILGWIDHKVLEHEIVWHWFMHPCILNPFYTMTPMQLRSYPLKFGLRFAEAMKYFQKEKSQIKYPLGPASWHIWTLYLLYIYTFQRESHR